MKNVTFIGTGYVGLVSGTGISDFGHKVTCYDISEEKINALNNGEVPIYEPGLGELIKKNINAGRLIFSSDPKIAIEDAEVVALCDPTAENLVEDKIARYVDGFRMGNIKTYTDFSDFFSSSVVDAMYFSIPPSLHAGEVLRAAERGVHLFVEKPVSLFLDEALEMERATKRFGFFTKMSRSTVLLK